METTIGYLMAALISLLIFYFIIKGAVKEAIFERMEHYQRAQTAFLKYLAKQQGMSDEDIEKALLGQKGWEWKQKHKK